MLIDVDPGYFKKPEDYLPRAKKVLDRQKLDWPNAIALNGFNDTVRTFNLSGYQNFVVDAKGFVRGIDLHGKELEKLVESILDGDDTKNTDR